MYFLLELYSIFIVTRSLPGSIFLAVQALERASKFGGFTSGDHLLTTFMNDSTNPPTQTQRWLDRVAYDVKTNSERCAT